jgi:hypothetical protein
MTRPTFFGILFALGMAACGGAVAVDDVDTNSESAALVPIVEPGGAGSGGGSGDAGSAGSGGSAGSTGVGSKNVVNRPPAAVIAP